VTDHKTPLEQQVDDILRVSSKFNKARAGRSPYEARGDCPVCRTGVVRYRYRGVRAVSMYCSNEACHVRMIS
jgi:hypothetical protein